MLLISNSPSNGPYALTGTGVAIVLFGLFGCFATCKGRPWMLKLVRFSDFSNTLVWLNDWLFNSLSSAVCCISGSGLHDRTHCWNLWIHFSSRGYTEKKEPLANTQRFLVDNTLHSCMLVCVQIKGTFLMTYNEAVMRYDGLDDRSLAVDGVQRRVSVGPFLNLKKMIWLILIKKLDYIGSWFNYRLDTKNHVN